MGIDRLSSKALPILAVAITACAGISSEVPMTRLPSEHVGKLNRSENPDKAVSETVEELRNNLKKAGKILDPDIVVCGDPLDESHSIFSREKAFDFLTSKYFKNMGGSLEGVLQRNFSILYLVKMPDGYQVFRVNYVTEAAKYFKGINFEDGVECIQAVPKEDGLAKYITKVDAKGEDPETWFDKEYKKDFPEIE